VEKLFGVMKEFGLSEYESRVMIALMVTGREMGASELSEISGVPRTSVYSTVKSLSEKGLVEIFGKPMKVRSIPGEELMNIFSRKMKERLSLLKRELDNIPKRSVEEVGFYSGDAAKEILQRELRNARKEVMAVCIGDSTVIEEIFRDVKCKITFRKVGTGSNFGHGLILVDGSKALLFFVQSGLTRVLIGGGEFASFYRELLMAYSGKFPENTSEN
jgi:sugar-specific transcriptional regulator TrmB